MFTRVVLQKFTTKSVKTSSTKAGRRWGHGLSLLNPLRILLDPFDVFGTAIADGMAELYGCPLLDGKHCIALSFRYEIKRMNSLEGNKIRRQKIIPMPRPNALRLKVTETKVHWQSRVTVDVSFFFFQLHQRNRISGGEQLEQSGVSVFGGALQTWGHLLSISYNIVV